MRSEVGVARRRLLIRIPLWILAVARLAAARERRRIYRVAMLTLGPAGPRPSTWWRPFFDELRELNYVEGRNLVVMYAGADAKPERLAGLATDIVKANVDVIVTTGLLETGAAKRVT